MNDSDDSLQERCKIYKDRARTLQQVLTLARSLHGSREGEDVIGVSDKKITEWEIALAHFRRVKCDAHYRIAVAGGFSTGKSEVINALLGEVIVVSDIVHTTFVPTVVRAGPGSHRMNRVKYLTEKEIQEILAKYADQSNDPKWPRSGAQAAVAHPDIDSLRIDVREATDLKNLLEALRDQELRRLVADDDDAKERPADDKEVDRLVIRGTKILEKYLVKSVSIDLPGFQLGQDVELVDLPGNDAADFWARGITERFVKDADAMILVLTMEKGDSASVKQLLETVGSWAGNYADRLFVVINKADDFAQYRNDPKKLVDFFRSIDQLLRDYLKSSTRPHIMCVSAAAALSLSAAHESACANLRQLGKVGIVEYDNWLSAAAEGGGVERLRTQLHQFLQTQARAAKLRSIQNDWARLSQEIKAELGAKLSHIVAASRPGPERLKEAVVAALNGLKTETDRLSLSLNEQEITRMAALLSKVNFEVLLRQGNALVAGAILSAEDRDDLAAYAAPKQWHRIYNSFRLHIVGWLSDEVLKSLRASESRHLGQWSQKIGQLDSTLRSMNHPLLPGFPVEQLLASLDLRLIEIFPAQAPEPPFDRPGDRELFGTFFEQFKATVSRWFDERLLAAFDHLKKVLGPYSTWHLDRFRKRMKQVIDELIQNNFRGRIDDFAFLAPQSQSAEEQQRFQSMLKITERLNQLGLDAFAPE